jgi:hypothetical protein
MTMRMTGTICVAAMAMLALGCAPHQLPDSMRDVNYGVPRPSPDMPNCEYEKDDTTETVARPAEMFARSPVDSARTDRHTPAKRPAYRPLPTNPAPATQPVVTKQPTRVHRSTASKPADKNKATPKAPPAELLETLIVEPKPIDE